MNEKIISAAIEVNPIIQTTGDAYLEGIKQYDPKRHDVTKKQFRPDRLFFKQTGKDDDKGMPIIKKEYQSVPRVPFAFQHYIINQKAQFAIGSGINLVPSTPDSLAFEYLSKNWRKNKTEFLLQEIAVRQMSETRVAVIFFSEEADKIKDFRLKFKIVSPEKGDIITAEFDADTDDLIAFTRDYEINKTIRRDRYVLRDGKALLIRTVDRGESEEITLPYTKLPVIYWAQDRPECDITADLIREYEFSMNEFITQQGYSADPILFGTGSTLSMPNRGEAGKYIEGEVGSDLKFVTPDNATESRDMQFKVMQKFIFGLNRAVFLDMETMRGLGDISGTALDRYLMDAFLEASGKQMGSWGIGVQRMVNFMVSVWSFLTEEEDLEVEAEFTKVNFDDTEDRVNLAMAANGGKPVISHRESISFAGLSKDVDETLKSMDI